ncbi:MAG: hypothetical protein K2I75_05205 [Clostridiales bacterium]|nr:hypothetical protein [Clostridiales bacterium]
MKSYVFDDYKYTKYDPNELNSLIDSKFGILIIAGSKSAYEKCAELNNDNIVMHEMLSETAVNVYTRLIFSPELSKSFMLENYNRVIFLDYPPSLNVIGYINSRTNATVYIPEQDNRAELFSCVKADRKIFGEYYNAIKGHSTIKAPNVYAYFKALYSRVKNIELPQFIACLSVFTQLKLLSFRPDNGITIFNVSNALENSDIYRTIEAWQ